MPPPLPPWPRRGRSCWPATAAPRAECSPGRSQRAGGRGAIDDQRRHRRHAHHRRARAASRRGRRHPDHRQPQPVALQRPEAVFRRRTRHSRPAWANRSCSNTAPAVPLGLRTSAWEPASCWSTRNRPTWRWCWPRSSRSGSASGASACCWTPTTAPAARWDGVCWRNSAAA